MSWIRRAKRERIKKQREHKVIGMRLAHIRTFTEDLEERMSYVEKQADVIRRSYSS